MKRFSWYCRHIFLWALPLFMLNDNLVYGQNHQIDSTIVESPDGSLLVEYSIRPFDFGEIPQHPSSLMITEEDKLAHQRNLQAKIESGILAKNERIAKIAAVDYSLYDVGAIPFQEGMTPSGARTYQIPISTAAGIKMSPSISICYNSQAGDGWVGYGWDIQGISSITLISKNTYYHGTPKGANTSDTDAVFALDGVALVQNTQSATMSSYPLITASGNILVAPQKNSFGYVSKFKVLYPNGVTAEFGSGFNTNYSMPSYPITQMSDLEGNKITFVYATDSTNGNDHITAIRYGYDSAGGYTGEITFSYTATSNYVTRYYAGKSLYRPYRLTSIMSKNGGVTLCQYLLSYELKDNVYLLNQLRCISSGKELRPLTFEYGASGYTSNYLTKENSLLLSSAFTSNDVDFVYKRGKFVSNSYNDGMLIYPLFPNYEAIRGKQPSLWGHWYYEYGSLYPAEQQILFAPSLADYSMVDNSIVTESGFQTIEAVDVDGDGLDELVKVNFDGISGSYTRLKITVYKCNANGAPVKNSQFVVLVPGTIVSDDYVSPYRREYYWGDFRGNGKIQLLTVAYDKNYNTKKDYNQTSYVSLIDIAGRSVLCNVYLFDFKENEKQCLLTCDLDNDSQAELCMAVSSGFEVYRFQPSYTFRKEKTLGTVNAAIMSSSTRPCYVTDLNGDGYIDILSAPEVGSSTNWTRYAFNGTSFITSSIAITSRSKDDGLMFIDLNQDGLSDLVKISGTTMGTIMNVNGSSFGSFQQSPSSISSTKGIVPANVVNRSQMSSFIKVDGFFADVYQYSSSSPQIRQLTKSVDSYGRLLLTSYEYLPNNSRYWTDNSFSADNSAGFLFKTLPLYVLAGEEAYMNAATYSGKYKSRYYSYFNGVINNQGLGFCGFYKIRVYDYTGNVTEITDETHDPQKKGVVTMIENRQSSVWNDPYSIIAYTYDNNSTTYGKLNPRLTNSVTNDMLTGIETATSYTYDSYDFPTTVLCSRRIGSGPIQTETQSRYYTHNVSTSKYILGIVTEETLATEGIATGEPTWTEKSVMSYDEFSRPISTKRYVGQGNAVNKVSETQWQYDGFGNIISEKTAQYGATEFTGDTFTYDGNGRYLLTRTDALGQTITYGDYDRFGNPTTEQDNLHRTWTHTYDSWGNLIKTTCSDGHVQEVASAWGGVGLYTLTRSETGQPETIVHYDALGREIRGGVKRFDGQWQWTDKEYDNAGRLARVSLPYRGSAAAYWDVYEYDGYGRPISLTEASGKSSLWSYNGTSVTTIKDGIASTTTTDAGGHVVSVTDAGGTITYALRNDSQPSAVTAPGNVKTVFEYDAYGRRSKITDPSAGVQTEEYEYFSDGSSRTTHTNPNGKIITSRDKYGRTTAVERPGEYNTTYTYDSYGRISAEQSTNGTGIEYAYDGIGRITTTRETVPDGKWLRKVYTYTTGSVLSTVQYITPSGPVTTEQYLYANGHNTGISLPDGTVVWRLESENDLGIATKITTGGITREYGFTAYGIPTYRKMDQGSLQDFSYQFDPLTGNLLQRQDGVNGKTEIFGYDELNRLTSMGSRRIVYDDQGNILSMGSIGSYEYGNSARPYQITALYPESADLVAARQQTVSYTCYSRPSVLTEGGRSVAFTYNGAGGRVKMYVADGASQVLSRYYIADRYEYDQMPAGNKERLYLGGDAYSAPMVYQRENGGSWTIYNIGRDYLGNITHIANANGTSVAEYSYDPWGRLRNPKTLEIYPTGGEPDLFLGRGFTAHEHLTWFGLINMNARLYDPLLGRFLSPDPYVQAPDFTQNYNRYSYALNNPLRYTDESGEYFGLDDLIAGLIGGVVNWATNGCKFNWEGLAYFGTGAAGGVASLYVPIGITTALVAGGNSMISQGFGSDGKWSWGNISFSQVGFDSAMGAITSALGGTLSSSLSKSLGNLTSKIPGKAWAGIVNRGLTGYATGFSIGAVQTAAESYKETGKIDWDVVWKNANSSGLAGLTTGAISGMAEGVREARRVNENPWKSNGNYSVYTGIDPNTQEVKYVGITGRNPETRWSEHVASGTERSFLSYYRVSMHHSKIGARIYEQLLINKYGLRNLYNKINSIAPKFWERYNIKP